MLERQSNNAARLGWLTANGPPEAILQALAEEGFQVVPTRLEVDSTSERARDCHARAFQRPVSYLAGLAYALGVAGSDLASLHGYGQAFHRAVLLADWLRTRQIAHLHVEGAGPEAAAAVIAARLSGVPLSLALERSDDFSEITALRLSPKLAAARFIVVSSLHLRGLVQSILPVQRWDRVEWSAPGIGVGEAAPPPRPWHDRPFEVLSPGPLQSQHLLLVRAIAAMSGPVRLTLTGHGPARTDIEEAVRALPSPDSVRLLADDSPAVWAEADAFVVGNTTESVPHRLLQAMSQGLPCIAPWVGGVPEVLTHESNGLLVPPADPAALSDALQRLSSSPERCQRLGQAARQTIEQRFNVAHTAPALASIFKAACATR